MAHTTLLTGATGFIGGELLGRLLARDPGGRVVCLIRARDARQLEVRRRGLLARLGVEGPSADRVLAVAGDVTRERLGIGAPFERLARDVDEIFHAAASTKFDLSLEDARAVNRDGALNILDFARRARDADGLRRLHHISTAYVAGSREGVLAEDDVPERPDFRNTYERTKWESEQILASVERELPITTYRPSIVVGDSRTGRTLHFRVLYDPMRWVYGGKIAVLPCRPEIRLDVVPVDFVCDALLALAARDDSRGEVYHLTSGREGAMTIGEIVDVAVDEANRYQREIGADPISRPTLVAPVAAASAEARTDAERMLSLVEGVMQSHVPYMVKEQLFENARACTRVGSGMACPPLRAYLRSIVRWGIERGFSVA